MKPFDEKLADNIREVFDNYHEPVDENAWSAMQDRLQNKKKVRIIPLVIITLSSVAAVAAFLVVSYFAWDLAVLRQSEPVNLVSEVPGDEQNATNKITITETDVSDIPAIQNGLLQIAQKDTEKLPSEITYEPESEAIPVPDPAIVSNVADVQTMAEKTFSAAALISSVALIPGLADTKQLMEKRLNGSSLAIEEPIVEQPWENDYAWIDNGYYDDLISNRKDRSSSMLVSAGSMKTYTPDELTGGVGFAAGLTGNFPLASNLSLQTGGALVYNHFSFDDMGSVLNARMGLAEDQVAYSDIHIIDLKNNTDYEFLAIDIPVNFRFSLSENPASSMYVTAGLSSFLYLQQNFTSKSEVIADFYTVGSHGNSTSQRNFASLEQSGEFDAFRRFDFARFLNLSAGYAIHRQDRTFIIEPFMKYPLGDVTSLDLNIGMAGVSLKYQFGRR